MILVRFCPILMKYTFFEESTGLGGLAGAVSALMAELDHPGKCITHKLPLEFIEHGPRLRLLGEHGFNTFL